MSPSPRPTTDAPETPASPVPADVEAESADATGPDATGSTEVAVSTEVDTGAAATDVDVEAAGATGVDVADLPAGIDDEPARGTDRATAAGAGGGSGGTGRGRSGRSSPRRLAGWIAMLAIAVAALVVGVTDDGGPRTDGERARDLSASIACPTCDGQSVADSDSSAARNVRTFIERRIADGQTDGQIRDELAARYGERILLTPGRSGLAGLVWALPVAALVAALAGVALAFRRWRGRGVVHATDADRELVDRARSAGPSSTRSPGAG